jgi:hypothetical protein
MVACLAEREGELHWQDKVLFLFVIFVVKVLSNAKSATIAKGADGVSPSR